MFIEFGEAQAENVKLNFACMENFTTYEVSDLNLLPLHIMGI